MASIISTITPCMTYPLSRLIWVWGRIGFLGGVPFLTKTLYLYTYNQTETAIFFTSSKKKNILSHSVLFFPLLSLLILLQLPESVSANPQKMPYPTLTKSEQIRRDDLRGRLRQDCLATIKTITYKELDLLRFGDFQEDYLAVKWPTLSGCMITALPYAASIEVQEDILLMIGRLELPFSQVWMEKWLESRPKRSVARLLEWNLEIRRRIDFAEELRTKNREYLRTISFQEFWHRNGSTYPMAMHRLGYAAVTRLMVGMENPDIRLKRYFLYMLQYLKTDYNAEFVVETLLKEQKRMAAKTDLTPLERTYSKELSNTLEYYRKK